MCEAVDVKSPDNTPGAGGNTGAFGALGCGGIDPHVNPMGALDDRVVGLFCEEFEYDPKTAWGNCEAFVSYNTVQ
jgi:hypothetical protein